MRTIAFGVLVTLGSLAACQTERDEVGRAADEVRKEGQEARKEVGREVQEGREAIGEARQKLAEELRKAERSGEPVEFDAVVVGTDPDTLNVRLSSGETFDVDFLPTLQATRGAESLNLRDVAPGTTVHVTYHYADGKRIIDEVIVTEPGASPEGQRPGAPGEKDAPTPGGTDGSMPGGTR